MKRWTMVGAASVLGMWVFLPATGCGDDTSNTVSQGGSGGSAGNKQVDDAGASGGSAASEAGAGSSAGGAAAAGSGGEAGQDSGEGGSSAENESGVAGSSGTDGAAGSSQRSKAGVVTYTNINFTTNSASIRMCKADASFAYLRTDCVTSSTGPCERVACPASDPDAAVPQVFQAGSIALTGGKEMVTLTPSADNTYKTVLGGTYLWDGDETLTVQAQGGDVPTFAASVTAPSAVTITAPTFPAHSASYSIDRNHPPVFQWTGGAGAKVSIAMATAGTDMSHWVSCRFDATLGTGQIPAAALADLSVGQGKLSISSVAQKEVDAGDFVVTINAVYPAVNPQKDSATRTVDFL
jgi:hypothetical protein